jgi:hypothetical protein
MRNNSRNGAFGKIGEKKIGKSLARRLRLGKGLLKKVMSILTDN